MVKSLNSGDKKLGALSDVSLFGISWRLNWLISFAMMADEVNDSSLLTELKELTIVVNCDEIVAIVADQRYRRPRVPKATSWNFGA